MRLGEEETELWRKTEPVEVTQESHSNNLLHKGYEGRGFL